MTSADRSASPAARSRSSAKYAPSGVTRMAAPLPIDPVPWNTECETPRHGRPS
ncbi:MAG: hypothetical protein U0797_05480 [Gemmataceae bacterium]